MLTFQSYASSSRGNLYSVTDGRETLLIECGVSIKAIKRSLGFSLSSACGVLLTHEHLDHAKAAQDVMKAGIDCYMSPGTAEALGVAGHYRVHVMEPKKQVQVGPFTVLPFDVKHDSAEPFGFLVANSQGEKLLYASDTGYIPYRFKGLTVIAVECNHSLPLLREGVASGRFPLAHKIRVLKNHMSIERLLTMLKANDLSRVREIHLLHLSDENSSESEFKAAVQRETGKPVYIGGATDDE